MNNLHNHPQQPVAMLPGIVRYGSVVGLLATMGILDWGFSISQASDLSCGSKSYLRHVQGLKPETAGGFARGFGTGWHEVLEAFGNDQIENGEEARSNLDLPWVTYATVSGDNEIALRRLTASYLEFWGAGHVQTYRTAHNGPVEQARDMFGRHARTVSAPERGPVLRPVSLELQVAIPVGPPLDLPFEVGRHGVVTLGRPRPGAAKRKFQPHFLATFDGVYVETEDADRVWLGEYKTAADPKKKAASLGVDVQTRAYQWALGAAIKAGLVPGVKRTARVVGLYYDVVSSGGINPPATLKPTKVQALDDDGRPVFAVKRSKIKKLDDNGKPIKKGRLYVYEVDDNGDPVMREEQGAAVYEVDDNGDPVMQSKLSRAASTATPAMWRAAISANGLMAADYSEQIAKARDKQAARFLRVFEFGCCPVKMARVEREISDHLSRIVAQYRPGCAFARNPSVCGSWGGCDYTEPCASGKGYATTIPEGFVRLKAAWYPADRFEAIKGSGIWPICA